MTWENPHNIMESRSILLKIRSDYLRPISNTWRHTGAMLVLWVSFFNKRENVLLSKRIISHNIMERRPIMLKIWSAYFKPISYTLRHTGAIYRFNEKKVLLHKREVYVINSAVLPSLFPSVLPSVLIFLAAYIRLHEFHAGFPGGWLSLWVDLKK